MEFNKPINNILKDQVDTIHADAVKKAKLDFKTKVLDKVENLEHFEESKLLLSEQKRINDLIDKNEYPFYIRNYGSIDWLLNQFSSRYFLLNVDESVQLGEGIYLSQTRDLLYTRITDLKARIPRLTFDEFLSDKECRYFNYHNDFLNIEEEDLYKIVCWQLDSIIKVVSYEVDLLIRNHQEHCLKIKDPQDFIQSQTNVLDELLTSSLSNPNELKRLLSELHAFKDFDLDTYNDELLMSNYSSIGDKDDYGSLTPSKLKKVLTKLSNEPKKIFSNEFTIFHTLKAFSFWLGDVIKGNGIQEPFKYPVWEDMLNQKIDEAKQEIEPYIEAVNDYASNPENSKKKVRKFLRDEFLIQVDEFTTIKNKKFFVLLLDTNRLVLLLKFTVTELLFNDGAAYLDKIKEAYIIREISWCIADNYKKVFNKTDIFSHKNIDLISEIPKLSNQMVLDKDLAIEFDEIYKSFFESLFNSAIPIDLYNTLGRHIHLFDKVRSRLLNILDNAEPDGKILYIRSRLKQLEQRESKLKNSNDKTNKSKGKNNNYPKILKKFLKTEADFYNHAQPEFVIKPTSSKLKKTTETNRSFKYKKMKSGYSNLTYLKESLINKGFISKNTDLKDFRKAFSGEAIDKPIVWTGNMSELSYFIKQIHHNLKYVVNVKQEIWSITINCFIQENGEQYNRIKLRGQKVPATSKNIDSALNTLK
jgi:hypothetical protein